MADEISSTVKSHDKIKIQKIKIENFKKIKHLEFEPAKVNIILGPNNTGKTSVLEAIYLALLSVAGGNDILEKFKAVAEIRYIPNYKYNLKYPRMFLFGKYFDEILLFRERINPFYIELKIGDSILKIKANIENDAVLNHITIDGKRVATRFFVNLWNSLDEKINIKFCFLNSSIIPNIRLENLWGEILEQMRDKEILELLGMLNPSIKRLLFIKKLIGGKEETLLYYDEKGINARLPIDSLGTGFKIYLSFAILTYFADVILFDDIESGFHHDLLDKFIDLIKKTDTQFFFTTQNKELIEKLIEELDDVLIVYLYRDGNYNTFNKEEAKRLLELTGDLR